MGILPVKIEGDLFLQIYLLDFQILATIFLVALAWNFGDWKNWERYYPTILFVLVVNFSYNLISYNYPLWEYESPLLKTTGSDLLLNLTAFPALIFTYLSLLSTIIQYKTFPIKSLYVLFWVVFLTMIEWFSFNLGFFSYYHGWNIWWSVLFNCAMFPIMWLHYKKPLWAIGASLLCAVFVISYFHIPFSSMK